jgi:hypothetical protein
MNQSGTQLSKRSHSHDENDKMPARASDRATASLEKPGRFGEAPMDIPLDAEVLCGERSCGRSVALVLNPVTDTVTHVVVKEAHAPHTERMVPASVIGLSNNRTLVLKARMEDLAAMEPFVETYFIRTVVDRYSQGANTYGWPYVTHEKEPRYVAEKEERIPPDEIAVHRGATVLASDGPVGKIDEFVVGQEDCHVTHLVMREGHLWGSRDVMIPISKVDSMSDETVSLRITKNEVGALPKLPVRRK